VTSGTKPASIRRNLVLQLGLIAALLSLAFFYAVSMARR